ncbi:uncharacterized protein B0H18DRAFT_983056 [Fomitopsis serialis]|uniref:uncharacterized protein n=1 Tax=Fomitopsis serialis TaxID=139415 RepID=UPI0020082085|nr:uncharacterized protein B0H18DRAFT_983056 [Neoantrodia serialis]KAH9933328.1 hypothetical protein B0H18DRAFT_983056 [Neoantrodia serialis]
MWHAPHAGCPTATLHGRCSPRSLRLPHPPLPPSSAGTAAPPRRLRQPSTSTWLSSTSTIMSPALSDRPHSIDLSLALERELESESLPNSPARVETRGARPQSLDTNVLASIVTQLRMSLEDNELAETKFREENVKDALESVADKCLRTEAQLSAARDKHQEDEEAIAMLRQKVEESRRALMRLQTESRRRSQIGNLSVDLSQPGSTPMNGPPTSKRASFTPLTGSPARAGHRRIVSLSDPGFASAPTSGDNGQWPTSPGFTSPDPSQGQSKRRSGMFGWGSSQLPDVPSLDNLQTDTLRKELEKVKEQLDETKHELREVQEAREASESCVRALRTFIAENSVGEQTARSTIRAATKPNSTPATSQQGAASRWGFKLWSTPETPVNSPAPAPSSTPSVPPVTRKLGGFFSPRSSISSTSSPVRVPQEPPYHGSDTSSIADSTTEPVSPASSMPQANILVQDAEGASLDAVSLPEVGKPVEVPV